MTPKFLLQGVLLIMLCIKSGWLMEAVYVPHHVVWHRHPSCLMCQVPDQCNSELLLWYFWSTDVQKVEEQLHCPLPGLITIGTTAHCAVRPVHITHVPFSLGLWMPSEFTCSSQNYPVLVDSACSSACLHVVFEYCGCQVTLDLDLQYHILISMSFQNSQEFQFGFVWQYYILVWQYYNLLASYGNHQITLVKEISFPNITCVPHFQSLQ